MRLRYTQQKTQRKESIIRTPMYSEAKKDYNNYVVGREEKGGGRRKGVGEGGKGWGREGDCLSLFPFCLLLLLLLLLLFCCCCCFSMHQMRKYG